MNKQNKFSPEVKERAVRLVQEHLGEYAFCGRVFSYYSALGTAVLVPLSIAMC